DVNYGTDNGDGFAGVAFTTGSDFTASGTTGQGIEMSLGGFTIAQCLKPSGCTSSVSDTSGGLWNVYDYCSDAVPTATSECYMVLLPNSAGASLPVNAYINIPNLKFTAAAGLACTGCVGATSVLPADGVRWSRTNTPEAWAPVYFNNGSGSISGTAHIAIYGAITPAGTFTPAPNPPEAHLYRPRFDQSTYHANSPYALNSSYYNVFGITANNTSTAATITTLAVAQPGPFSANNTLQYVQMDPKSSGNWSISAPCPGAYGLSAAYFCLVAKGAHKIAAGTSETVYFDENPTLQSFGYADWIIQAEAPFAFALSADGTAAVPVSSPALNVDTLAFGEYSLDSSLMAASFSPGTASTGGISNETVVVQNTSQGSDPFPDYVDAIIIEAPNTISLASSPTVNTAGWIYLGSNAKGANTDYWFGVCAGQYVQADGPPAATPLAAVAPALPQCSNAQESNSLAPSGSFSALLALQNLNTVKN
ncbi:MAG: hypothetical protein ACREP1_06400, partial [Rhodanobacteraceae bacterium]